MEYEFLGKKGSNYEYELTLKVYRDDLNGNPDAQFEDLIKICVFDQSTLNLVTEFWLDYKGKTVVKPPGYTDCPFVADGIRIEEGIYRGNITLPKSNNGYICKWERCCRSTQNNLVQNGQGSDDGMSLVAYIPSETYQNSSPVFSELPIPYICLNDTTDFKSFATDKDGDSLRFFLVRPFDGAERNSPVKEVCDQRLNNQYVTYRPGYSGSDPFGNDGFTIMDNNNGLIRMFCSKTGVYSFSVEIREYRNGKVIGRTYRDIQVAVFSCPLNRTPTFSGFPKNVTVEAGEQICLKIFGRDFDTQDDLEVEVTSDLFTGTLNRPVTSTKVLGSSTVTDFCWQTECNYVRTEPYLVTFEIKDDGCPPKSRTENMYITVKPFVSKLVINGAKKVCHQKEIVYSASNLADKSTVNWSVQGDAKLVKTLPNGDVLVEATGKSFTVVAKEINKNLCVGGQKYLDVEVYDPVPDPIFVQSKDTVCQKNTDTFAVQGAVPNIMNYQWIVDGGTILGSKIDSLIQVYWTGSGLGKVSVSQQSVDGCFSDTIDFPVFINYIPAPLIKGPVSVCPNNAVDYIAVNYRPENQYDWFRNHLPQSKKWQDTVEVTFGDVSMDTIKLVEINPMGCASDTGKLVVKVDYELDGQIPRYLDSLCEGTKDVSYDVELAKNSTYDWAVSLGAMRPGNSINHVIVDWDTVGTGYVSVIETAYDSVRKKYCRTKEMKLLVDVHPNPTTVGVFGKMEYCQDVAGFANFSVTGFQNSTFDWKVNNAVPGINGQGNDKITFSLKNHGVFDLWVKETTQYGCTSYSLDTSFIVNPKPTADAIFGESVICFPNLNNHIYSLLGFDSSSYEWNITEGTIVREDGDEIEVDWLDNKEGQLFVIETSKKGCIGDTVVLDVWIDHPNLKLNNLTVAPPPESDSFIYLFWELSNAERYNAKQYIERRIKGDAGSFVVLDSVDGTQTSYKDKTPQTDDHSYEYRIRGKDLCGNAFYSDIHASILLRGDKPEEYVSHLSFEEYIGWANQIGSNEYFRMLPNKQDYTMYSLDDGSFEVTYENGVEHFTQCYRVKSTEGGNGENISWSNEVCHNFEPFIYIPNAFTPNDDSNNEEFGMVGGSLKTIKLEIFNRWGELLHVSNGLEEVWDGTYGGVDVPKGVYIYVLQYTSYDDTVYTKKGTITLLK